MARGKYKSTTEARQARETALEEAARLRRQVEVVESQNAALQAQVDQLRSDLAAGVAVELTAAEAKIRDLTAALAEARDLIARARTAMTRTYEDTIRGLMKMGIPLDIAADRVDEVTTFLVGDELLPYTEVVVDWAVNKGQVQKIRKRNKADRKVIGAVNRVAKVKDRAAYNRAAGGIG